MTKLFTFLTVIILLTCTTAMAQVKGSVRFITDVINEGSTGYITAVALDENKQLIDSIEAFYYMIVTGDGTPIGAMNMCTSQAIPSPCHTITECGSGSCEEPQPYECSGVHCEERYFCTNRFDYCDQVCEEDTPAGQISCDDDTDCGAGDQSACTGGDCNCIGKPRAVMDLTAMPIAQQIQNTSGSSLIKERRRIVAWFIYPDNCVGADCVFGLGEAEYDVQGVPGICVTTAVSLDGTVTTTCP